MLQKKQERFDMTIFFILPLHEIREQFLFSFPYTAKNSWNLPLLPDVCLKSLIEEPNKGHNRFHPDIRPII